MGRKITTRWVVGRIKQKEIDSLFAQTHPGIEKGDKSYPGLYQKCLSTYIKSMSEQEQEEMKELQVTWQEEGPPMDLWLK